MRTLLAVFLDKEYPPGHSFVDGFLASALPRAARVRPVLFTSRRSERLHVRRYGRAISCGTDPENVVKVLSHLIQGTPPWFSPRRDIIDPYSRSAQAQALVELLESVLEYR